jgi:hypothetical protein
MHGATIKITILIFTNILTCTVNRVKVIWFCMLTEEYHGNISTTSRQQRNFKQLVSRVYPK